MSASIGKKGKGKPSRQNCPTPWKRKYRSKAAARKRREFFHSDYPGRLEAYECSCGYWHLWRNYKGEKEKWEARDANKFKYIPPKTEGEKRKRRLRTRRITKLFSKYGEDCPVCSEHLNRKILDRTHPGYIFFDFVVLPREGGRNRVGNLVLGHQRCLKACGKRPFSG
ncbi:hypothetical protein H8D30_00995 [bacterium]|nr:hypothetical protein [bacterium]